MISSLFRLASVKKVAEENNKNDAKDALKPHMQSEVLMQVDEAQESSTKRPFVPPENIDQLSDAVRDLLMSQHLEVSKVRPFFWSMVETYIDRFHIYPFDVVKALFYYLESADYPADEMRDLVKKLEECYDQQHGEPMHKSTQLVCGDDGLEDELKDLRESIKYASLVGELEEEV
jgi:hypothetical protein